MGNNLTVRRSSSVGELGNRCVCVIRMSEKDRKLH